MAGCPCHSTNSQNTEFNQGKSPLHHLQMDSKEKDNCFISRLPYWYDGSTLASTTKCNTRSWPSGWGLSLFVNSMIRLNPSFCFLQHAKPVTNS